jgi:DNA-binding NtrC family response regulator
MEGVGSVLVIDDEPVLQDVLGTLLRGAGFDYHCATSAAEGLQQIRDEDIDVVLLDLMLPDRPGLELIPEIKSFDPHLPVVVITAYSSVESAIEAMRLGAFHYVPKPFKNEEVLHLVRRASERRRLLAENLVLRSRLEGMGEIIGTSRRMQEVYELIRRAAPARSNIMITGESGTGKELVARAIHRLSPRNIGPFVPVHTSAIPSELLESSLFGHIKGAYTGADRHRVGRFEASHEGTIFLDEVGDIPPPIQIKLLRVLEEKEIERVGDHRPIGVDVRIVTATNRDLEVLTAQGMFREDLFFRISVFPLHLPSLSERLEDIPLLVQHFIRHNVLNSGKKIEGMSPAAMATLTNYAWPGNVRELRSAIEYAFVLCKDTTIESGHLPPKILHPHHPSVHLANRDNRAKLREREDLVRVLRQTAGNQSEAARILGVSRVTIWKRIKKYGIKTIEVG